MRRYGDSSLCPGGMQERTDRCIAEVSEPPHYIHRSQCLRKRGHGPDGLYCKQHAKMVEEGRFVHVGREEVKP